MDISSINNKQSEVELEKSKEYNRFIDSWIEILTNHQLDGENFLSLGNQEIENLVSSISSQKYSIYTKHTLRRTIDSLYTKNHAAKTVQYLLSLSHSVIYNSKGSWTNINTSVPFESDAEYLSLQEHIFYVTKYMIESKQSLLTHRVNVSSTIDKSRYLHELLNLLEKIKLQCISAVQEKLKLCKKNQ